MIIDRCCEHIVEVLESLFQEMMFMVSYEGEIGKNQTKDLGMKHAEQKRRPWGGWSLAQLRNGEEACVTGLDQSEEEKGEQEKARGGSWGQIAQGLIASLTVLNLILSAVRSHRRILSRRKKYNQIYVLEP